MSKLTNGLSLTDLPPEMLLHIFHNIGDSGLPHSTVLPSQQWYYGEGSHELQTINSCTSFALSHRRCRIAGKLYNNDRRIAEIPSLNGCLTLTRDGCARLFAIDERYSQLDLFTIFPSNREAIRRILATHSRHKDVWLIPAISGLTLADRTANAAEKVSAVLDLSRILCNNEDVTVRHIVLRSAQTTHAATPQPALDMMTLDSNKRRNFLSTISVCRPSVTFHWKPVMETMEGETFAELRSPLANNLCVYTKANASLHFDSTDTADLFSSGGKASLRWYIPASSTDPPDLQSCASFGEHLTKAPIGADREISIHIGGGKGKSETAEVWKKAAPIVRQKLRETGYRFKVFAGDEEIITTQSASEALSELSLE